MTPPRSCTICGATLTKKPGPGRWPRYCSDGCRRRAKSTGAPRGRPPGRATAEQLPPELRGPLELLAQRRDAAIADLARIRDEISNAIAAGAAAGNPATALADAAGLSSSRARALVRSLR